ncbi:MAG: histidine phosphatase family protein [Clostridia bacterium]|nr:histidine phosphatase family protein [Clostridia bacterium]
MTTFLLIRHGESMANTEKRFAGHWDIPLSPLGQEQAETTAKHIAATYAVDAVYASDLQRAYRTGKAVADRMHVPIIADKALREICAGDWEQQSFDDLQIRFADSYAVWLTDIGNAQCDNGESVADLQSRFLAALRRIANENDGKTVVIATHATPIRALQCHCAQQPLSEMHNIPWATNASITTVTCENGAFKLIAPPDDSHLGNARTVLPANV